MNETVLRSVRLALASLITVALFSQLLIGLTNDTGLTAVRFFSYFTVLSNTAAVALLTALAFRPNSDATARFAMFRGAVTVYMSVTFLVYVTILYPQLIDVGVPEPWIDVTIHLVGPLIVAADWMLHPPPTKLPPSTIWWWMTFPAAYVAYSLIRGPIVDWYPYPFLDPEVQEGYFWVGLWCVVIASVIAGIGWLYYWWANRKAREPATV